MTTAHPTALVEMITVVGIATAHSRAMGRPDPTDDELTRLLLASDFAAADIARDLATVQVAVAETMGESA